MAATIAEKFQETRSRIHEQGEQLQSRILDAREKLEQRSKQLRFELDLRRERALGRLRLTGLERVYTLSEQTLRVLAELLERAARQRALKPLDRPAQKLIGRAEDFAQAREELHRPSIDGYDNLNVSDVNAELGGLSAYELERVREYETENKNRVTVLREIDRRLEALRN